MKRTHKTVAPLALAALALVSACDEGKKTQVKKIEVNATGGYVDQLRALSQRDRGLALRRAVNDAKLECRRVKSSAESGKFENMTIWTVRCDGEDDWAVFIAPNGDAQVRSCRDLVGLDLPPCKLS